MQAVAWTVALMHNHDRVHTTPKVTRQRAVQLIAPRRQAPRRLTTRTRLGDPQRLRMPDQPTVAVQAAHVQIVRILATVG